MRDYDYIELITDNGQNLSGSVIARTHSRGLASISETVGSVFIELCDYIACYDLFEGNVSEENIYYVVVDAIQLIDMSYIISCYPFFDNGNIVITVLAKLEGAPEWVKYGRETFSLCEIIAHSVQSKNERYAQLRPGDKLRLGFNSSGSLLHSPDIDRWLAGEP